MSEAVTAELVVEVMDLAARAGGGCTESEAADAIREVLAFSPDQERDERGRFGGGGGGGGGGAAKESTGKGRAVKEPASKTPKAAPTPKTAPAPKKAPKAADAVKKAADKVAKAKAAVTKARDGLVKAQKELKDLKAKAKAESPRAKAAAARAAAAKPVDVAAHVQTTKRLNDDALAGKVEQGKGSYGSDRFVPKETNTAFRARLDEHVAALGKTLNKAGALEVARQLGHGKVKTKAAALKAIGDGIWNQRAIYQRGFV